MINVSLSRLATSSAQLDNEVSRGSSSEKSSAAADKARFAAAIGSGGDFGAPMIGISFKPNSGSASDPASTRSDAVKSDAVTPHAVIQLGPLVAGQQVGRGEDAGMAATAFGAAGPLVGRQMATEHSGNQAAAALRTVFEIGVAARRADLEVPSTLAAGMEAGRERLARDMQREAADTGLGASSARFSAASLGGGTSSVDTDRITAPISASSAKPSPANNASSDVFGPQTGSSNIAPSNAPMTISLSPAGSAAQAFTIQAPRISTAEIGQAMHNALAAAQQERPITETREKDLLRAQQERPIDVLIKEDLEAAKAKLKLPGGEQELLFSALGEGEEGGVIDAEAQMALLERANTLLEEKYQMILDDFSARMEAKSAAEKAAKNVLSA